MSYRKEMARAIEFLKESPKSDGLSGRFRLSLSEFLAEAKQSKNGQHAGRIAKAMSNAGLEDQHAIAFAVLAAAESAFSPFARHKTSGASGYFQLIPRYFRSAGPSNTNSRLIAQATEIAGDPSGMYGFKRGADPISIYASHFLPGLGRIYRKNRSFGIQAGTKTYDQYVFTDDAGTLFHSPILMFAYTIVRFIDLVGFDPQFEFPVLDYVVARSDAAGSRVFEFYEIEGLPTTANGPTFRVGRGAVQTSSSANGSPLNVGPSFVIGEKRALSNVIKYTAADGNSGAGLAGISSGREPRFSFTLEGVDFESYADYRDNVFMPSLDSFITALRDKAIDANILESVVVLDFLRTGKASTLKSETTGRMVPSDEVNRLKIYVGENGRFLDYLLRLSNEKLADLVEYCLCSYLETASISTVSSQLALHIPVSYSADMSEEGVLGGLITFEADNSREPYRFDIPWLAYEGVLFPFSLLAAPVSGDSFSSAATSVSHKTIGRLNDWARDMVKLVDPPAVFESLFKTMAKN